MICGAAASRLASRSWDQSTTPTKTRTSQNRAGLYAINLDPDSWGLGFGRELLAAATEELGRLGFTEAVLWVATGNARARRFYEAAGWHADGTERTDDSLGPVIDESRYRRRLASQP